MKNLISLALFMILISFQSYGQQLAFDQVGSDPAYCRLFGYQSGNGVAWASATGGTPPYIYQWTNLSTQSTISNPTFGGLNPGDYEIKIWDDVGDSIYQIVTVDSVNPEAIIEVVQGPVIGTDPVFTGTAPVTVEFINQSLYFANIINPNSDTTFFWRMTQWESWYISHDYNYQPQYTYSASGQYEISLIAINKNGCQDTSSVWLWLLGPSDVDELDQKISIVANPSNQQLILSSESDLANKELRIYDMSGRLLRTEQLNGSFNSVYFNEHGLFIYELIDQTSGNRIASDKFQF